MPSTVPGYLEPQAVPAPLEDQALEDFFQQIIKGLSALDDELVRPDWQEEPPTQPERVVNWIAFGITSSPSDGYPAIMHDPDADADEGNDELQRHETMEIALKCYGPNAGAILRQVRDSIQVDQNLAVLTANGFGFQETTEIVHAPVLSKSKWQRRFDMKMILRRIVVRNYQVLSILESDINLEVELSTKVNP